MSPRPGQEGGRLKHEAYTAITTWCVLFEYESAQTYSRLLIPAVSDRQLVTDAVPDRGFCGSHTEDSGRHAGARPEAAMPTGEGASVSPQSESIHT